MWGGPRASCALHSQFARNHLWIPLRVHRKHAVAGHDQYVPLHGYLFHSSTSPGDSSPRGCCFALGKVVDSDIYVVQLLLDQLFNP